MRRVLFIGGLAMLAVLCGVALGLARDDPRGRGSVRLADPVATDRRAQAALERFGRNAQLSCTASQRDGSSIAYAATLDADAGIQCKDGRFTLSALHYPTADAHRAGLALWERFYASVDGSCNGGVGYGSWTTRDGSRGGRVICASGNPSRVVWSDDTGTTVSVLAGPTIEEVLARWHALVRPMDEAARRDERRLRVLAGAALDTSGCTRDPAPAVTSLAALTCRPVSVGGGRIAGVERVRIQRFADERLMRRQFAAAGGAAGDLDVTRGGCEDGAIYARSTWMFDGRTVGNVKCYPSGSAQLVIWTVRDRRLVMSFARKDGSPQGASEAWVRLTPIGLS